MGLVEMDVGVNQFTVVKESCKALNGFEMTFLSTNLFLHLPILKLLGLVHQKCTHCSYTISSKVQVVLNL